MPFLDCLRSYEGAARQAAVAVSVVLGVLSGYFAGRGWTAAAWAALALEVAPLLVRLRLTSFAIRHRKRVPGQLRLEAIIVAIGGFPCIPWGFALYFIAPDDWIYQAGLTGSVLVGALVMLFFGSGSLCHIWVVFWDLALGFLHYVIRPQHSVRLLYPLQCGYFAPICLLASLGAYHKDRCALNVYAGLTGMVFSIGWFTVEGNVAVVVIYLLSAMTASYALLLYERWHRTLPPGLKGCKFVRLDALRDMVARGDRIRRCQDLPASAFGDPERARFLVVISHRWIDPHTCDVATPEHPAGLRLETMVAKLDGCFSPASFWKGCTLTERINNMLFSLASPEDVVVFFDFMSMPQVGMLDDGTSVPRTPHEEQVFNECLANMGVLYSMFNVLVCDEVPTRVPSYLDSGWCFSELMTASLGRQLATYSPDYDSYTLDVLTNGRMNQSTSNDDMMDRLDNELKSKVFREEQDRALVRDLVRGFLLKRSMTQAIRQRDLDKLAVILEQFAGPDGKSIGRFLDQPVDNQLNTPLHEAVAGGFKEGALLLVKHGACCKLRNLRGDTPLQWWAWPRFSAAAITCRLAAASLDAANILPVQPRLARFWGAAARLSRLTAPSGTSFRAAEKAASTSGKMACQHLVEDFVYPVEDFWYGSDALFRCVI